MPKVGATSKSPVKQEMDAEARAIASLSEALERHQVSGTDEKTTDTRSAPSDGERRRGERFAIYIEVERHRGLATVLVDKAVPSYTWNDQMIKDHLSRDIPEMTQLVILSPTACMAFKGRRSVGEGYTGEEATQIVARVAGARQWAGTDAFIAAYAVTLGEARHILVKARDFIRTQRLQALTTPKSTPKPVLKPPTKQPTKGVVGKEPEHRRSKVKRADKYWAKKLEAGHTQHTQRLIDERLEALTHPPLIDPPYSSGTDSADEPYESVQEPVGYTTDPSPYEVTNSEDEGDDVVEYDTEASHQVTVAERNRLRKKQQQRRERRERQRRKERLAKGATLPLFKNSSKEGATPYVDWRNCVDEMIADKLDEKRIRSLVMQSLEGPPKDTARLAFKKGKGTLKDILKALDKLYGRSASYVHLQSEMCNIQQLYKESAQDYYERLVRLQVAIQDKYPERLHELELERTAQEAFYNGLRDEFKPMIVHMLENPLVTVGDLVEAVRKIEAIQERRRIQRQDASHYPASTSTSYHKPAFNKDKNKDKDKGNGYGKGAIKAKAAQVQTDIESETDDASEYSEEERAADENALWRDGYYCCAIRHADQSEQFFGACFNCRAEGHRWRQCPDPLRPALQEIKDKVGKEGDRLNVFGDDGERGAAVPKKDQRGQKGKGAAPAPKPKK